MNTVEAKISTGIASQGGHWYRNDGAACYEIEKKKGGMRPVDMRDARKHRLVPSVTSVMKVMAKPALEVWKQKQVLLAALTLPMHDGESLDDYAARIMADSKQQAIEAARRGTNIHAAIEAHFCGDAIEAVYVPYVVAATEQIFAIGSEWEPEKSFAHPYGYGGKVDLHSRSANVVLDVKTKEFTEADAKKLIYDEHSIQLAAYRYGLDMPTAACGNVFVSVSEPGLVQVVMHDEEELQRGWRIFQGLLSLWKEIKRFDPAF
jgi:hypothetical protein